MVDVKTITNSDDSDLIRRACGGLLLLLLLWSPLLPANEEPLWLAADTGEQGALSLYFFWSRHCPHCAEARPLLEEYAAQRPWLVLHSLDITANSENLQRYRQMAAAVGQPARSVPAFFYCGVMATGFDTAHNGRDLFRGIESCHQSLLAGKGMSGATMPPRLPDELQPGKHGLFTLTVMIAALDAFNPCAFFVLLFLLGMLSHAHSRTRMLMVGAIFVLFSALLYFLFMSAWLNLFMLVGLMRPITVAAALLALLAAAINIKSALYPALGISLSIPEDRKPGLFRRMRELLRLEHPASLLLATTVLAVMANSYELLCTSGLPMVYTRILTLEELPTIDYYLYLLLYNVIYVLPLAVIVVLFSLGVARGRLQAMGGRLLKLLSGLMMGGLGGVLMLAPELLSSPATTILIVALALLVTLLFRMRWKNAAVH